MKRICTCIALFFTVTVIVNAQTGALQGHSFLGGKQAITSGLLSTNYADGIIPAATITIYLTGTTNLATGLTSDGTHPLSNPFLSNAANSVNPGGWIAFAATTQAYDVVASGGGGNPNCTTAPNCYAQPVTLCKDCFPSSQFTVEAGIQGIIPIAPIEANGGSSECTGPTCAISCPNGCSNLQVAYTPQASGQYILAGPVSCATSPGGALATVCGAVNSSGSIIGTGGLISNANVQFTGINISSLPAGATITSVYVSMITSASGGPDSFLAGLTVVNAGGGDVASCSSTICFVPPPIQGSGLGLAWSPTQVSFPFSALPTNYANVVLTASGAGGGGPSGTLKVLAVIYEIHYTGTAPPANTALQIAAPLVLDNTVTPNVLGLDPLFPNYFEPNIIAQLPTPSGLNASLVFPVTNGANSSDCSTGGGTSKNLCQSSGSAYTAIGQWGGGGGSGITQLTGDVVAGPGSGSQAATLATVNSSPGSCGDSTHVCQVTTNGKGLVTAQAPVAISGGGGSGTVSNCSTVNAMAFYAATGTVVSCDTLLLDNGTTLTYSGSGGLVLPGSLHGITIPAGMCVTGSGSKVIVCSDATIGNLEDNPDNTGAKLLIPIASGFTSGDCGEPTNTSGVWWFVDSGSPCGSGGGGGSSGFPFTIVQEGPFQCGNASSCAVTFPQTTAASGNTDELFCGGDGSVTFTAPSGWTTDVDQSTATSGGHLAVYHKASSSDTGATVGFSSTASMVCYFMELVGSRTFDQLVDSTASSPTFIGAQQAVTFGSITPSAGAAVFGLIGYLQGSSATSSFPLQPASGNWRVIPTFNFAQASGRAIWLSVGQFSATASATAPPPAIFMSQSNNRLIDTDPVAIATISIK